jgi:hypothetical protein
MGHGGGTIKFKFEGVMLLALALAICIAPLSEGLTNQNMDQNIINSEIKNVKLSNANSVSTGVTYAQVNAAKTYKKYKYKKYRSYKYKKYRSYKYKKYRSYKYKKYRSYKYKKYWSSKYHKYIYVKAAYTYKVTVRYTKSSGKGTGDCWTNSEILFQQLKKSGLKVRIIQYASSMSPRHRSVQIYKNGKWVNYDYKANGYAQTYYATSNSVNGVVVQSSS